MAVSEKPWDFRPGDYNGPQAVCFYSLINDNTVPKGQWVASACKLPVYEPDGTLNRNAVHAAAAALAGARGGVHSSPQAKRAAARKLIPLYGQLKELVPDSVRRIAGG